MDIDQISGWKATLEKEIEQVSEQLKALNLELDRKRQQLELLSKLVDSETGRNRVLRTNGDAAPRKPLLASNPSPSEVKDRVLEILTEANRPMNIKEIHAEFVRKGLPIPGKGTPFNILVHMAREVKKGNASRFFRTGKGTYAIRQRARAHQ